MGIECFRFLMEKAESLTAVLWDIIFLSSKVWKRWGRVCGINPCQLDLISYCSLFCIEHLWMDGLFLQHSCTLSFSTLLFSLPDCFSLPPPLWMHTSFLSVAMQMILEGLVRRNAWIQGRWENKSAYNSFNQAADGCVMPEPGVLCICMRYTFPPEGGR